ncbi:hypothetical protein K2173_015069 [Erythroxylum novogranatense]|uniref:Chlororespiratory reduction 2 n=1 Tax=Erythroxylum novogranatense TaxID=1862640 RepID=A0AAV8T0V8_9ROSI|nr:hypothetical protein K2173_015069 [Erythroxylum novogranatense]
MVTPSITNRLWNSKIRQFLNQGKAQKALLLFRQMKQSGTQPDNFTFLFIFKACAILSNVTQTLLFHTHVAKSPFLTDSFVQTSLLHVYAKSDRLDLAYQVFAQMPKRDVASWNAMLVGFVQTGDFDTAFDIFREMRVGGALPDSVTIMGLSQAVSEVKNLELAKGVHSFGIRVGVDSDVSVANTWMSLYAKCGDLEFAESIFNGIEACLRSVISWNSMIASYSKFEKYVDALNSYKLMLHDGYKPDISTIISLLSSFVQPEAVFQGMLIHSQAIKYGFCLDVCVANTLVSMYSKCGVIDSARCLFDGMHDRTAVSWSVLIAGYARNGNVDEVLALFNAMEAADEKPNLVAMLSIISGCGQAGILELGKWMDAYADSNGLKDNAVVCNALIDMYAKCGSMPDAQEIFYAMSNRTIVSWTAMIAGYALNGLFGEALDHFYQMLKVGLKPNHVTFLAVLQACSHAGFLEKGRECFNMMTNVYKINPGLDHYSCMVDLLGRRGKLKEAMELIEAMSVKPDAAIWGTLLNACKIHCNIAIGEYAAHHLFKLEPHKAVPYVEMANLYASARRWDGFRRIRTMMHFNRVRKNPGQSFVVMNGKSHAFTVDDRGHHEHKLIYEALDALMIHLKKAPYDIMMEFLNMN